MTKVWTLLTLASMPAISMAGVTLPVPDPSAQQALNSAASTNATGSYDAGVAQYASQSYQTASATAHNISQQDATALGYYGYGGYARQQAASEAQSVANAQSTQSQVQDSAAQQGAASSTNGYTNEMNAVASVQQANDSAVSSAVVSGTANSLAAIANQTGVLQGQLAVVNDTGYLLAGAGTQALMNGLSTDGYEANDAAIQAAQNASSCADPYCAAAWWAVNGIQQARADADYAANVAAAPVLAATLNSAALSSAITNSTQQLQQIEGLTGVAQGQSSGVTSTAQAMQNIGNQTGVAQGQTAEMVSTDTSYTSAADAQQATLNSQSQNNESAAVTAAQAWQAGQNAQRSMQAAQTIQQYDLSMAGRGGYSAWDQAANIAQRAVNQQSGIAGVQQSIQDTATATENASYSSANSMAPSIAATLNTAAANSAGNAAQTTIQQIGAATGVAQ